MISTHLYGIIRKQIMSLFSFRSFDHIKKMLITIFYHVNCLARDHLSHCIITQKIIEIPKQRNVKFLHVERVCKSF